MRLSDVIATCGGVGLSPHAPGTVGSALALPLIFIVLPVSLELQLVVLLALFVIGVWASERPATPAGRRQLHCYRRICGSVVDCCNSAHVTNHCAGQQYVFAGRFCLLSPL